MLTSCRLHADPQEAFNLPETLEDSLEHGVARCIAFNGLGTLLAGTPFESHSRRHEVWDVTWSVRCAVWFMWPGLACLQISMPQKSPIYRISADSAISLTLDIAELDHVPIYVVRSTLFTGYRLDSWLTCLKSPSQLTQTQGVFILQQELKSTVLNLKKWQTLTEYICGGMQLNAKICHCSGTGWWEDCDMGLPVTQCGKDLWDSLVSLYL